MINIPNSSIEHFHTAPVLAAIKNTVILKRIDDGFGGSAVAAATGAADEDIVGIAHINPLSGTEVAVVGENAVAVANKFNLKHAGSVAASVYVWNVTKNAKATVSSTVNGLVTTTGVDDTDILTVNYRRSLTLSEVIAEGLPLSSLNRQGSTDTSVEFASGRSVAHLDVFDTTAEYAIGKKVYSNADGLATTTKPNADSVVVGTVASVPQGAYPWLAVSGDWRFA